MVQKVQKMKKIEIAEKTWKRLQEKGLAFVDSPDDVINRALDAYEKKKYGIKSKQIGINDIQIKKQKRKNNVVLKKLNINSSTPIRISKNGVIEINSKLDKLIEMNLDRSKLISASINQQKIEITAWRNLFIYFIEYLFEKGYSKEYITNMIVCLRRETYKKVEREEISNKKNMTILPKSKIVFGIYRTSAIIMKIIGLSHNTGIPISFDLKVKEDIYKIEVDKNKSLERIQ